MKNGFTTALLMISTMTAFAQERIDLYPGQPELKIAGGRKIDDVPHIDHYPAAPDKKTGEAILICPGGGYQHLAIDHEGKDIAAFFTAQGFEAIVLHYRLNDAENKGSRFPSQYNDVTNAMRLVKSKAAAWKLDPEKIGVIGFSAGGHLASTLTTMIIPANPAAKNELEKWSSRPAFAILVYPVISMSESFRHKGSTVNLLGPGASQAMMDSLSTDKRVTAQTPPTFLVHSTDDKVVPVENSWAFYSALKKNNISASLHIYDHGGHGYGMGPKDPVLNSWPGLAVQWLRGVVFKPKS
ncbi:alpha/beta hydrolase [Chitinophaga niabensis]|uniref:alpha/beta hydrolase n=1 Tax=Chitinophaga niabensis TaxID=536979 RepID=UPI0031B9E02F